MKTTLFFLVVLILKLFFDIQEINWKSWLDGVAIGVVITGVFVQIMRRKKQ